MNSDPRSQKIPSPLDVSEAVGKISAQSQAALQHFVETLTAPDLKQTDPLGVLPAFAAYSEALMRDPTRLMETQWEMVNTYMQIWQNTAERMLGLPVEPLHRPDAGDRRFKAADWENNPFFDYLRQTYLATAGIIQNSIGDDKTLDEHTRKKVAFYMSQFIDALSPTNFIATNPDVLHATVSSGGRNLVDGLNNFLADLDPADGRLHTRMVDKSAFELGKNVATTAGKVVYQNELMQLIQYDPSTPTVCQRPLLIVPPWINKFYILDLQQKNSFIKAAVDQGMTVFVISWVNPDASLAKKDFVDYMHEGPLAALDAIEQATGERVCNVIGYCLGGTLMATTLAYMKAKGQDRIASATFFTAMIDFTEPGDLGVFIDREQLDALDEQMAERGYLDGSEMASTFNMLRANDLIWSFVVNNYLLGQQPMAFDLLFWNDDSTRMPARMHSTYLRQMYLENKLCRPGGIHIDEVPIDISSVDLPVCFVSAVEDHIAPWKSTYDGARLFSGEVRFILSQAGHIAGIINPPGPRQYGHYTGPAPRDMDADSWFEAADYNEASWWSEWAQWVVSHGGDQVPARTPGDGKLEVIEDAPGSYVRVRTKD